MWQWLNPLALWGIGLPLAAGLFFVLARRTSASKRFFAFSGLGSELEKQRKKTRWIFRGLFGLSMLALIFLWIAIARPVQLKSTVKKWTEGIDISIVFDVSESMDADDFLPSRLTVAKSVVREFVSRRPDDRIGLVTFAGEAVMKSPLTRDHDFLLSQVDAIRLRELKQGTAIGSGLVNGIARLRKSESKNRVLILLTDGDSNVGSINPMTAAQLARSEGIRVYTIGIGKADRVVIPIYAYDSAGRKTQEIHRVPSYLNPELLKAIARITGGKAYMARDEGMLSQFLMEIDKLEKTKTAVIPLSEKEELYRLPSILALVLLVLVFFLQETRFQRVLKPHAV